MLVSFFRTSRAQALIMLPFLALLLRLPAFWRLQVIHSDPSFLFTGIFGWAQQWPVLSIVLSAFITFFIGLLTNNLIQRFDLLRSQNYLTAFFTITFLSLSPDFWFFNSEQVAVLFLIFALNKTFHLARSENTLSLSFEAALMFSLAGCFSLPLLLFFLLLPIAQLSFSSIGVREFFVTLIGLLLPFYFWWGVEFVWVGTDSYSLRNHLSIERFTFSFDVKLWQEHLAMMIALLVALVLSMGSYLKGIQVNTVKTKNTLLLFLWILVFAILSQYVFQNQKILAVLLLSPAVIAANYSTYSKKKWIPEIMIILILLGAGYTQWTLFG